MGDLQFKTVQVAVTVIQSGQKILTVYNPKWGSFTLPMTKRRQWQDPSADNGTRDEEWADAAARAAAEWLGRTFGDFPEPLLEIADFQQSDREGTWKWFRLMVFRILLDRQERLVDGAIAEWLADDEFQPNRRPISDTARHVIAELKLHDLL